MIDWSKPIQTRCGRPARLLCTDLRDDATNRSVAVAVTDANQVRETIWRVRADGRVSGRDEADGLDIVNVPPAPAVRHVYMVRGANDGVTFVTSTRTACDDKIEDGGRNKIIAKCVLVEGDGIGGEP